MTSVQQLQERLGVVADGHFGPKTGTALWRACLAGGLPAQDPVVVAARREVCAGYAEQRSDMPELGTAVMIGGKWRPLDPRVPLWVVPYRMYELKHAPRKQTVVQVILHHDAAGSAPGCFGVLLKRGLSTHFGDDDNGVVLQYLDPCTDVAWHAMGHVQNGVQGRRDHGFNFRSLGFDLSNPVDPETRAGKADSDRELVTEVIHGRKLTRLDFYPCQEEAALASLRVFRREIPTIGGSYRPEAVWRGDLTVNTPGMFGHYHVNAGKIDPFGFPMHRLAEVTA